MSVHSRYSGPLDDQRQFFDELITEEWPSYTSEAWDFSRRSEVSRLLRALRPARILDIGCGCGFHDVEMAKFDFVSRVDAFDYSGQSVLKADDAYPHSKVFRRVADITTDQVDAIYDLVVSFQVFEHLPNPDAYLNYCLRACRPGGAIAIVTPNRNRLDNRIRQWRGEPPAVLDSQHFREYTLPELQALGRSYGLTPIDSFGHGFQSLIYPRITPKDYRRLTRLGAALPAVASVIGVVFRAPPRGETTG